MKKPKFHGNCALGRPIARTPITPNEIQCSLRPQMAPGAPFPGKRIISTPKTGNQYGATICGLKRNASSEIQVCFIVKNMKFHHFMVLQ